MIDPLKLYELGVFMKIRKVQRVNPVAKASRNKSGAGAHKSKKDYDRKVGIEELIELLRQRQGVVGNGQTSMGDWLKLETAIQSLLDTDEDWDGE